MKKNECLTLRAENLGADMEGVCRHEGIPVFVPGLLPDEETLVRIVKSEKRYAFGRMEHSPVLSSPSRRKPQCTAYPLCGGCSCRHMSYTLSLEAKRQQVQDCFRRIASLDVNVSPTIGMDLPDAYRNKTSLPVSGTEDNPVLGFYAPRSHRVVPVSFCPNAMPPANEIASVFLNWMRKYRIPPWQEEAGKGLIRHLIIRVSRTEESQVTIVCSEKKLPHTRELAEALRLVHVTSLWLNENRERNNVILSDCFHHIYGDTTLKDRLFDLTFELSPASFFQVNPVQTEILYGTAGRFADLQPSDLLCDVYCGVGTIALSMAKHCRSVIGIEIVPAAVENAMRNAVRNCISNTEFRAGKAENLLPKFVREGLRPDVIITDPPRKGLDPLVIQAIADAAPRTLIYISCNPATLARDAGLLHRSGYTVQQVQPVDMFCWTSGIETVVQLSQQKPDRYVRVGIDLDEMDVTPAESKASYQEIKDYVLEHTGLKVSCLYIAQVKAKHGIIERDCYNKPKTEGNKVPKCPPEKEKAIEDALRHFQMIKKEEA